jgi:hypothetical protein
MSTTRTASTGGTTIGIGTASTGETRSTPDDRAEVSPREDTGTPTGANPEASGRATYGVAAAAALLALVTLLVGGTAMSLTARTGRSTTEALASISTNPWPFLVGGAGLVLVSLFDIFTIPGLHAALGRDGRVLIMLATTTAVIGDLLGMIGRLAQTALVPLGLQTGGGKDAGALAAGQVLGVLDTTVNTAGFMLVSVSFSCFGLLMLRGFSRAIGWVAIVAGVFTLLGQIPALAPLFMVANVAYVAWYIAIGRRFWLAARRHPARRTSSGAPVTSQQ